ncbi:glycosyltransferase [Providencia sp. PROV039]|uniref:glycosyltransferase n=1 Tax=Providencia sp. PROV039 TaxID=2949770 RepID=UPI00234ACB24|nr:glycosyltransferase family 4 protein [Providencia sp. PROV039]
MSKLLFVHDHLFTKDSEGYIYSSGTFPCILWNKYLNHFSSIHVIGRFNGTDNNASTKYVLSSHDKVSFSFVKSISNPIALIKNYTTVYNAIYEHVKKADSIIVRLPSENGLLAAKIAIKLKKPLCIEVVGCAWGALTTHGSLLAKIYAPIAYLRMRKAIQRSKYVLYVTTSYLQSRYPACNNAKTVCASNVSIQVDTNISNTKEFSNKYIFGLIGNYKAKYKGLDVAIKALSAIEWNNKSFELHILGKGEPSEYIELAKSLNIENHIKFHKPLPSGKLVLNWLDNIDIYIQPSLTEGLPRALIEAMSRGCIALGSDAGGIPELLDKRFLHKAGNIDSFKKSIVELLKNEDKFEEISFSNFEISKKYDSSVISKNRDSFFQLFSEQK